MTSPNPLSLRCEQVNVHFTRSIQNRIPQLQYQLTWVPPFHLNSFIRKCHRLGTMASARCRLPEVMVLLGKLSNRQTLPLTISRSKYYYNLMASADRSSFRTICKWIEFREKTVDDEWRHFVSKRIESSATANWPNDVYARRTNPQQTQHDGGVDVDGDGGGGTLMKFNEIQLWKWGAPLKEYEREREKKAEKKCTQAMVERIATTTAVADDSVSYINSAAVYSLRVNGRHRRAHRARTRKVNTEQTMTCSAVCRITCYDVLFHFRCELYSLIDDDSNAKEAQSRRQNRWMVRARASSLTHKHATPTKHKLVQAKTTIFKREFQSFPSLDSPKIGCSSHCNVLLFVFLFFAHWLRHTRTARSAKKPVSICRCTIYVYILNVPRFYYYVSCSCGGGEFQLNCCNNLQKNNEKSNRFALGCFSSFVWFSRQQEYESVQQQTHASRYRTKCWEMKEKNE